MKQPVEELVLEWQETGSDRTFERIVNRMRRWIGGMAKSRTVFRRTFDFADAQQHCLMGLLDAAKSWDPSHGVPFVPYAKLIARRNVQHSLKKELEYQSAFRPENSSFERAAIVPEESSIFDALIQHMRRQRGFDRVDEAILLGYFGAGYTLSELADKLEMSFQAVHQRMTKMITKLQGVL